MKRVGFIILIAIVGFQYSSAQLDTINQLNSEGLKAGYWMGKYPSGERMYEGFFRQGIPIGILTRYYKDGTIKARLTQQDDAQYYQGELYDEKGQLRASGLYLDQKKQGEWVYYSSENKPLLRVNYQLDSLTGKATRYFVSGKPMEITHWNHQKLSGPRLVYNELGEQILECYYVDGKMHGVYKAFNDSGVLIAYGKYNHGLKEGLWQYFNQAGDLKARIKYHQGIAENKEVSDSLQQAEFLRYEQQKLQLKDPLDYLNDPFAYIRR